MAKGKTGSCALQGCMGMMRGGIAIPWFLFLVGCSEIAGMIPGGHTAEDRANVREQQARIARQGKPTVTSTLGAMRRVCDYQLQHPIWAGNTTWIRGAFYTGVMATYRATGDRRYLETALRLGEANQWKKGRLARHADDQAIGQMYLEVFEVERDPKMIASIRGAYDAMMKAPRPGREEWWWCDALFMAPPALARLASVLDDRTYLDFMDGMWWDTTDFLHEQRSGFYFRDQRYFARRESNGEKVFWSRGNGWVAAGICRVLEYMPPDYSSRERYVRLLQQMAASLAKAQCGDGLWRTSLLDPDSYPLGETSGSGFHCFAIAWGINRGYLDGAKYRPVVERAWRALMACVDEDGKLCYVQRVAGDPQRIKPTDTMEYGSGAFLLAGEEMLKLLGHTKRGESVLLPPDGARGAAGETGKHPLHSRIQSFLKTQAGARHFQPTGLSRRDYLAVIEGQVKAMRSYQDDEGRIIDPIRMREFQYATPCYAHAVAVLHFSGHNRDAGLLESGMRAMDWVTSGMAAGVAADHHGDFFTYPAIMAFRMLEGFAPAERVSVWRERLAAVDGQKLYRAYGKAEGNWTVVNLAEEFLRWKAGMTPGDYVEETLGKQLGNFTDLGMYHEVGDPLPYDHFPRHFLAGILQLGYRGSSFVRCRDLLWRGGWTSLFMQSPFGELPTGYRSSHHIWNEAESAVTYEIYAAAYGRQGMSAEAGAFKRAARLSLQSIRDWIREDGSGYIVKNRYPIESQHGYEGYSAHTQYNLLACSMLAQAWLFADDSVSELAAPCDVGGYVVPIVEKFHKVFAAAGGNYVEYDTCGDQVYNPTGLIRIHLRKGHPQLGPSDGCAERYSGKGNRIAVGPAWQECDGTWHSLAEMQPATPTVEVLSEHPHRAAFRVTYKLKASDGPDAKEMQLVETVTVTEDEVTLENEIYGGDIRAMRINYPALVFDGQNRTEVGLTPREAVLTLEGRTVRFELLEPGEKALTMERSGAILNHRNGQVEILSAQFAGRRARYRIHTLLPD